MSLTAQALAHFSEVILSPNLTLPEWSAEENLSSGIEMFVTVQEFLRTKTNQASYSESAAALLEIERSIAQYLADALQSV